MGKPYHIVAPAYTESSAGAKALHLLCDALNRRNKRAYLVPMGEPFAVNSELNTPIANIADENTVVIYPEIVEGNPLNAKHVVRWLLYYAGHYRGNARFPETDLVVGYTTRIAKAYGTSHTLLLPTVDDTVFKYPPEGTKRKGSCYYAHKYRNFYGGTPDEVFRDSVEITNPGQSREELINLLQTSTVLYAFEDTALIFEAVLCGCPVICIPSASFKENCGLDDFKPGIAWGLEGFGDALHSLPNARRQYQLLKDWFEVQLDIFIAATQEMARG